MTADVPRRAPLTEAGRQRTIATTVANGSQFGGTRMAKTVPRRVPTSTPYTAPSGGGGYVGRVWYRDPGNPAYAAAWDPSHLQLSQDDTSSFAYDSASKSILLLRDGLYQVTCFASVGGAAAGDLLELSLFNFPDPGQTIGQWTSQASVAGHPNVTTAAFRSLAADNNGVGAVLTNTTGSGGTISAATICIIQIG